MKKGKLLIIIGFLIINVFYINCNNDMKMTDKNKKYDFLNAPKSKYHIADYECMFSEDEFKKLINGITEIEKKYKINIFIITAISFNGLTNEDLHFKQLTKIFGINHIKGKDIIIEFSENEKRFGWSSSDNFNRLVNEKRLDQKIAIISSKYFDSRKYYQAFKEMLEAIEQELQKSII